MSFHEVDYSRLLFNRMFDYRSMHKKLCLDLRESLKMHL
jgi:hypothetical protein